MAQILIIDDEPGIRIALKHALKLAWHDVILAENGDDGLHLCHVVQVDLVILDLFMPGKDGLVTIIEMRKEFPTLPILAVSGGHFTSHSQLAAAQQLGANKVLEKPFDAEKFLAAIQEVLQLVPH